MNVDPCRPVRTHLSDQLDGEELPVHIRMMVRLHLSICPPCRRTHRSLIATRTALRALRDSDAAAPAESGSEPGLPAPDE